MLIAVASLLLVLLSVTSVLIAQRAQDDADWVTHSLEVRNRLFALRTLIRRAESGQRGFLLTGEADYLQTYVTALNRIQPVVDELAELVADNPFQVNALAAIRPRLAARLTELAEAIRLYRSGDPAAALALVRTGVGYSRTLQIEAVVGAMERAEERLLAQRNRDRTESSRMLVAVAVVGAFALLALGLISLLAVRRANAAQLQVRRVLETSNQRLEAMVAERTTDLREANAEIQRFAYIVSHDLRSPLVNIMGFTSELEMVQSDLRDLIARRRPPDMEADQPDKEAERLDHDLTEALGFIKASTGKMDKLINAILTLSRQGRREFHAEPVSMTGLVEAIAGSVAHQLQAADGELVVHPLPDIVSDRMALEQIFGNLIDNAVKYLRPGVPGRIEVDASDLGPRIAYRVRDNGRGIDEKDRERVFELFRRSGAQDRPGEGIGLAHVRALVRRLGGTITFDSALGQGTTFTVALPRHIQTESLHEIA